MLGCKGGLVTGQTLLPLEEAAAAGGDHRTLSKFHQRLRSFVENVFGKDRIGQMEKTALAATV